MTRSLAVGVRGARGMERGRGQTTRSDGATPQPLSLPEELLLMLLNEESGYFYQVSGWDLHCAFVGAALAELSLMGSIDQDEKSLFVLDPSDTGNPTLDPIVKELAAEPVRQNVQYWIERLAPRAESIIESTLDHLVRLQVLEHHNGGFWTPARHVRESAEVEFVRTRIGRSIFSDQIPDPRDVIIVCLLDTCDVFRFMFALDDEAEERIRLICRMDLIGRSMADAVTEHLASLAPRRSVLTRSIPTVSLRSLLINPHVRRGYLPALFTHLAQRHGPVFQIRPPLSKPMIFLAGVDANRWVQRRGRLYLRANGYLEDFEKIYGASGILPALDGADHFRFRRAMSPAYSHGRLAGQMDQLLHHARAHMAGWTVGGALPATSMCRLMINAQISPLAVSVYSQDIIEDLMKYKERALTTHVVKALPKFLLHTPAMRRRARAIDTLVERVQNVHTPAQRAGSPRDLADDLLSLHASDQQFLPESNLRFALSAPLVASIYLGDALSFAVYAMATQPELYGRIRREADALFDGGDPDGDAFTPSAIDVTHRFLMECLRLYPVVPMSLRDVVNECVVEGHTLPVGARIYVAQTATHFMEEVFPEPFSFDIDRYLPPRNEHRSPGYAPYGVGTHMCLGSRWMELQLAVNVLLIARHFTIDVPPAQHELRFNPIPSMKPSRKLKFVISERRRELPS